MYMVSLARCVSSCALRPQTRPASYRAGHMEGQVAQVSARFQEAHGYTAGAIADRRIQLHRAEDTLHSRTRSYDARRSELATAAGLQMCCCGLAMFLSCSCAQSCSVRADLAFGEADWARQVHSDFVFGLSVAVFQPHGREQPLFPAFPRHDHLRSSF